MRLFGIFIVRSDSGAGSSGFLVDEVRVGRPFGIFVGRSESGAGFSRFLVGEVTVGRALRDFL